MVDVGVLVINIDRLVVWVTDGVRVHVYVRVCVRWVRSGRVSQTYHLFSACYLLYLYLRMRLLLLQSLSNELPNEGESET